MKIAFFVAEFPVLSETFVIRQVAGMVQAGHEVTVIAGRWGDRGLTHGPYREFDLERRVRVLRNGSGRLAHLRSILALIAGAAMSKPARRAALAGVLGALRGSRASLLDIAGAAGQPALGAFDAVIAHFGQAGVRAMHLQQAGLLTGPLATIFHGFDVSDRATLDHHRRNYRDLFDHCARLLPISRLWRSRLREWGAPEEKLAVLRMGVDVRALTMLAPARPLHRPLRVLSVARFTEKKGLEYAIEGVKAARVPVDYRIIGSGPDEGRLRALAQDLPGDKRIEFLGRRTQQEVFAALEATDLFLLPSVTAVGGDMEGVPVALMEAMAKGVLVLATRHSGIPELIDDTCSGFLVAERDAPAIAACLEGLVAHDGLAAMRMAARGRIEREFDEARALEQLQDLCRDMSSGHRFPARGNVGPSASLRSEGARP